MDAATGAALIVVGIGVGALVCWLALRARLHGEREESGQLRQRADALQEELGKARESIAVLEVHKSRVDSLEKKIEQKEDELSELREEQGKFTAAATEREKAFQEKIDLLTHAGEQLKKDFALIAREALKEQRDQQDEKAAAELEARKTAIQDMLKPIADRLGELRVETGQLKTEFAEQLKSFGESFAEQKAITSALATALRTPSLGGRYGEWHLKQVLTRAGLQENVHYLWQETEAGEEGSGRPEAIILHPTGDRLPIDAKTPWTKYEMACNADDDRDRSEKAADYTKELRNTIADLGKRKYHETEGSVGWVVLYLPFEGMFSLAVQHDYAVLDYADERRVFLAPPMLLLAMLRGIALDWRQLKIAEHAQEISGLGRDLYDRAVNFAGHMQRLGRQLDQSVSTYNDAVGSLENRLLPQARRFKALGAGTPDDIGQLEPLTERTRELRSDEMRRALEAPPSEEEETSD